MTTYEMKEMGIEPIDLGMNEEGADDESLHLKDHDSLDHHGIEGQFSKSFHRDSMKLELGGDLYDVNKSSIHAHRDSNQEVNQNHKDNCGHGHKHCDSTHDHSHHDHSHHHHNHSHHEHHLSSNLNVRAAFIHIIGDIIQAVGVLIAALIIYAFPSWQIIDPL